MVWGGQCVFVKIIMWLYWNDYWAAVKIERNVSSGGICPLIYDPKIKYLAASQETLNDP